MPRSTRSYKVALALALALFILLTISLTASNAANSTDQSGTIVITSNGMTYTVPLTATTVIYLPIILEETPTPATATPTETPYAPLSDVRIMAVGAIGTPETATIWNMGAGAQDMTGWFLFEVAGLHTYQFPYGYILASGASVQIQSSTGAIDNPPAILFWTDLAVWNDTGDRAVLYDNNFVAISRLCYGTGYLETCP